MSIEINGLKNINESINKFIKPELLSSDNRVFCQKCKKNLILLKVYILNIFLDLLFSY